MRDSKDDDKLRKQNTMKIRKAAESDLKEITRIFKGVFNERSYKDAWTNKSVYEHIMYEFKTGNIFVFNNKAKILGMVIVRTNIGPKHKIGEMIDLAVIKEYRNKGIGSVFLKGVEKLLKKEGYYGVSLETSNKSEAFNFYRKNKYRVSNLSKESKFMFKKLK